MSETENDNQRDAESASRATPGSSAAYQYLAVLCHSMDDVPLYLSDCRESAFKVAEEIGWDVTGTPLAGALDLPAMDTPVCTVVVTFRDGVPCSRVVVREFDDDDDDSDDEESPIHEPDPMSSVR